MSPRTFARRFRRRTGATPVSWVNGNASCLPHASSNAATTPSPQCRSTADSAVRHLAAPFHPGAGESRPASTAAPSASTNPPHQHSIRARQPRGHAPCQPSALRQTVRRSRRRNVSKRSGLRWKPSGPGPGHRGTTAMVLRLSGADARGRCTTATACPSIASQTHCPHRRTHHPRPAHPRNDDTPLTRNPRRGPMTATTASATSASALPAVLGIL